MQRRSYYTVRIPWVANPTKWHPNGGPFKRIDRGAFGTRWQAVQWAITRLGWNTDYSVVACEGA